MCCGPTLLRTYDPHHRPLLAFGSTESCSARLTVAAAIQQTRGLTKKKRHQKEGLNRNHKLRFRVNAIEDAEIEVAPATPDFPRRLYPEREPSISRFTRSSI